jgi:hypothetical protein
VVWKYNQALPLSGVITLKDYRGPAVTSTSTVHSLSPLL